MDEVQFEKIEEKSVKWIIIIGFVLVFAVGFAIGHTSKPKFTPPEQLITYLEEQINSFPPQYGNSALSQWMTIDKLKVYYWKYKPISTSVMVSFIGDLCSQDWKNADMGSLVGYAGNACEEFCGCKP